MTKRIEWYVDERAAGPTKDIQGTKVFVLPLPIPCYPAVLFIGENGEPPKVYTEEDRAKDRELLQMAADALADPHKMSKGAAALSALKDAGITPTEA